MDIKYHLNLVKQYDAFKHLSWNIKCVVKVFLLEENKISDFSWFCRFNRYGEKSIIYLCHKLNFTTNDSRAAYTRENIFRFCIPLFLYPFVSLTNVV